MLHCLFLAFVSSKAELSKFSNTAAKECKEAMKTANIPSKSNSSEVVNISSLGTEWAEKLERWLQLHPDFKQKQIEERAPEQTKKQAETKQRKRRYTIVNCRQLEL